MCTTCKILGKSGMLRVDSYLSILIGSSISHFSGILHVILVGRWRTQRKAPVTLPPMPNLSIDRVPSRKTPILLIQQTGRKIRSQPDEQSVDKIARREKVCKQRPDSKKAQKGTGGSKEFVPWCK